MRKLLLIGIAALSVLGASAAQRTPAAEEMPSFEAVKEFAHQLFEMSKKQGLLGTRDCQPFGVFDVVV